VGGRRCLATRRPHRGPARPIKTKEAPSDRRRAGEARPSATTAAKLEHLARPLSRPQRVSAVHRNEWRPRSPNLAGGAGGSIATPSSSPMARVDAARRPQLDQQAGFGPAQSVEDTTRAVPRQARSGQVRLHAVSQRRRHRGEQRQGGALQLLRRRRRAARGPPARGVGALPRPEDAGQLHQVSPGHPGAGGGAGRGAGREAVRRARLPRLPSRRGLRGSLQGERHDRRRAVLRRIGAKDDHAWMVTGSQPARGAATDRMPGFMFSPGRRKITPTCSPPPRIPARSGSRPTPIRASPRAPSSPRRAAS
jgi:hypothetical protein